MPALAQADLQGSGSSYGMQNGGGSTEFGGLPNRKTSSAEKTPFPRLNGYTNGIHDSSNESVNAPMPTPRRVKRICCIGAGYVVSLTSLSPPVLCDCGRGPQSDANQVHLRAVPLVL